MNVRRLLPLLLLACSCAPSGPAAKDESAGEGGNRSAEVEALITQYGNAVLANEWNTAYAMLLPEYQNVLSQDAMAQQYQELISEIVKDDPQFRPNTVSVGMGTLPTDEATAKEYGIQLPPPQDTWVAWLYCGIGESATGEPGDIERGVETSILVVEMYGKLQIAHIDWQFMD